MSPNLFDIAPMSDASQTSDCALVVSWHTSNQNLSRSESNAFPYLQRILLDDFAGGFCCFVPGPDSKSCRELFRVRRGTGRPFQNNCARGLSTAAITGAPCCGGMPKSRMKYFHGLVVKAPMVTISANWSVVKTNLTETDVRS